MATIIYCDKCGSEKLTETEIIHIAGYDLCECCFRQLVSGCYSWRALVGSETLEVYESF